MRRFRSGTIILYATAAIILVTVGPCPFPAQSGTITMRVDPAARTVPVNGTFTVNIVVDVGTEMNPYGLGVYEFDLVYDPNCLEVLSANDAGGLVGTGRTAIGLRPGVDNANGRTAFGVCSHPPEGVSQLDGPTGTVVLATVTLQARRAGATALNLENALAIDTHANVWPDAGARRVLKTSGAEILVVLHSESHGD